MANPSIDQLFIQLFGHLNSFVPGLIILRGVKLLSSVSCRDHVDDSLVSSISQRDRIPGCLIKQSLPGVLIGVSTTVHHTAVTDDHTFLV